MVGVVRVAALALLLLLVSTNGFTMQGNNHRIRTGYGRREMVSIYTLFLYKKRVFRCHYQ